MHFQNIFKMAEFEAQNTLLGKYYYKGKEKIVCACEDFTDNEHMLEDTELENMNSAEIKNLAINCYSCIKLNEKNKLYVIYAKNGEQRM